MDQYERQEKKREAMRRLGQQRQRAGELRRRVVVTSLVAFVLLWAVVFAQMATGNDPVLGDGSKTLSANAASTGRRASGRERASATEVEASTDSEAEAGEESGQGEEAFAEEAAAPEVPAEEVPVEEVEAEAFLEEPEPVITSQS